MASFFLSIVVFLVTVAILFFSQIRTTKRRKARMHDIAVTSSNIIQLHERHRRKVAVERKVDDAVELRR